MVDVNRRFIKNSQILYKDTEDGAVLVDTYRRAVIRLNPVASEIWRLLDHEHSVGEIVELLKEAFDAPVDVIREDTLGFIKKLTALEIIE